MISYTFMSALNMKFHRQEETFQGSQIFKTLFIFKGNFFATMKDHLFLSKNMLCRLKSEKHSLALFQRCTVGGDMRKSKAVSDSSIGRV